MAFLLTSTIRYPISRDLWYSTFGDRDRLRALLNWCASVMQRQIEACCTAYSYAGLPQR